MVIILITFLSRKIYAEEYLNFTLLKYYSELFLTKYSILLKLYEPGQTMDIKCTQVLILYNCLGKLKILHLLYT